MDTRVPAVFRAQQLAHIAGRRHPGPDSSVLTDATCAGAS